MLNLYLWQEISLPPPTPFEGPLPIPLPPPPHTSFSISWQCLHSPPLLILEFKDNMFSTPPTPPQHKIPPNCGWASKIKWSWGRRTRSQQDRALPCLFLLQHQGWWSSLQERQQALLFLLHLVTGQCKLTTAHFTHYTNNNRDGMQFTHKKGHTCWHCQITASSFVFKVNVYLIQTSHFTLFRSSRPS